MDKREESVAVSDRRPRIDLIGTDGNVFSIIGKVSEALKKSGMRDSADEFVESAMVSDSYEDVLKLATKYVRVVGLEDQKEM